MAQFGMCEASRRKRRLGGSVPSPIAQVPSNFIKNKIGVWHRLVVRLVRDQEAAGSNPVTPTNVKITKNSPFFNKMRAGFLKN